MDTLHQLLSEAEIYQRYAEQKCPSDPSEINERIRTLQVYVARTGQMLAEAKLLLNRKKSSEIAQSVVKIAKEGYLSAKAQNAIIDSIAAEEKYLVDWLDRLNAACTHQVDHTRSLLAYEREQMRLLRTGY